MHRKHHTKDCIHPNTKISDIKRGRERLSIIPKVESLDEIIFLVLKRSFYTLKNSSVSLSKYSRK